MHAEDRVRHQTRKYRRRVRRRRRTCFAVWILFAAALVVILYQTGLVGAGSKDLVAVSTNSWYETTPASVYSRYQKVNREDVQTAYHEASQAIFSGIFDAEGALLMRGDEILYKQNEMEALYPASMTKLVTALVALEYGNPDDMVVIQDMSATSCYSDGSKLAYLQAGDRISLRDLLGIMLVYSANDAATAIALHIAGSEAEFAELANEYARELGAVNTHFTNPHGLHNDAHYTCANDMMLFLKAAVANEQLLDMMQTENYIVSFERNGSLYKAEYPTTSLYLTGESAIDGFEYVAGKTGYTGEAGRCLAACFEKDGEYYYSVVMHSEDYVEATTLLYYYMEYPDRMQQIAVS